MFGEGLKVANVTTGEINECEILAIGNNQKGLDGGKNTIELNCSLYLLSHPLTETLQFGTVHNM